MHRRQLQPHKPVFAWQKKGSDGFISERVFAGFAERIHTLVSFSDFSIREKNEIHNGDARALHEWITKVSMVFRIDGSTIRLFVSASPPPLFPLTHRHDLSLSSEQHYQAPPSASPRNSPSPSPPMPRPHFHQPHHPNSPSPFPFPSPDSASSCARDP